MRNAKLFLGSLLVLTFALSAAHAGTVMVIDTWAYDQFSDSGTHTWYLEPTMARIEFKTDSEETWVIYDLSNKDEPVMYVIEPNTNSYMTLDKKSLDKAEGKMREGMEMMENYMSNMPAEQRDAMKKQYGKQIRQAEKMMYYEDRMKKMKYEKVAGGEKIEEWTCDHFKATFKKEVYKEIWVAPWDGLGVGYEDLAVLASMAEMFKGFAGEMIPFMDKKAEGDGGAITGFPVKTYMFDDGKKVVKQEVKEVRKEDIDAKLFELPEGFDEREPVFQ